jgi:hypothetical protein
MRLAVALVSQLTPRTVGFVVATPSAVLSCSRKNVALSEAAIARFFSAHDSVMLICRYSGLQNLMVWRLNVERCGTNSRSTGGDVRLALSPGSFRDEANLPFLLLLPR